jgi:hypothetical protein
MQHPTNSVYTLIYRFPPGRKSNFNINSLIITNFGEKGISNQFASQNTEGVRHTSLGQRPRKRSYIPPGALKGRYIKINICHALSGIGTNWGLLMTHDR